MNEKTETILVSAGCISAYIIGSALDVRNSLAMLGLLTGYLIGKYISKQTMRKVKK